MNDFGTHLKDWRTQRRLSQLDLAMEADVSARHISFLETGRSAPSRMMIQHLSEVLDVPHERRNDLLEAAGFAGGYKRSSLSDDHMRHVQEAMMMMIDRHDPYPAIIKDQLWNVVGMNNCARFLFGAAGVNEGDSLLEFMCQPGVGASAIENWGEVGHHVMSRIRNENKLLGGLPELDAAIAKLAQDPDIKGFEAETLLPPIISTIYRAGGMRLSLFSTFAQFGGAEDLSLTELQIELMFPADDAAKAMLESLG